MLLWEPFLPRSRCLWASWEDVTSCLSDLPGSSRPPQALLLATCQSPGTDAGSCAGLVLCAGCEGRSVSLSLLLPHLPVHWWSPCWHRSLRGPSPGCRLAVEGRRPREGAGSGAGHRLHPSSVLHSRHLPLCALMSHLKSKHDPSALPPEGHRQTSGRQKAGVSVSPGPGVQRMPRLAAVMWPARRVAMLCLKNI